MVIGVLLECSRNISRCSDYGVSSHNDPLALAAIAVLTVIAVVIICAYICLNESAVN